MERVRSISRQLGGQPFGAARAYVVLDNFFSMEPLYLDTFRRRGLPVSVMRSSTYCARKSAAIEQAAGQGCEAFLLFEDTESCEFRSRHPSVQGTLYDSACDATQRSGPRMARQVVP
jgi:hypothetical protein